MEELQGGREGSVYRSDDKVYRPSGFWSEAIHKLFDYLRTQGLTFVPESFGFDHDGNEILSYVPGEVYNYPLIGPISTDEALCSAAKLLREYHDATTSFIQSGQSDNLKWLLPTREPQEVICHGDYAPYNVALKGDAVNGIFDFDAAHPAPRIWDIAYAVYCWAPFKTNPEDALGDLEQQSNRAKQFCDAYGLLQESRLQLVDTMIERVQALVNFMLDEAEKGNAAFAANIEDGHHLSYIADIEYLRCNQDQITQAVS